VGGLFWGVYLTIASWYWGDEPNSAFSAMRLDSYKNFIRLKIESNKITIYPIGIDKPPQRSDWKINDNFDEDNPNQDIPAIIPKIDLGQHLIEEPVIIDINNITPLRQVY
jgi:uncharacterized Zn-finger protein